MTRWTTILGLVVWSLAAPATPAVAQTQNDDIQSLRGLPGVGVLVLGLPDRSTDRAVMTSGEIQAGVEAQLRQAGIRPLSREELSTIPSRPYIQIDFFFVHTPADIYFYIVQVTMRQSAVLASGQRLSVRTFWDATSEWTSPRGTRYPARWRLRVPKLMLDVDIQPRMANQELNTSTRYWEGASSVSGTRGDQKIEGKAYVELVGY